MREGTLFPIPDLMFFRKAKLFDRNELTYNINIFSE